MSATQQASLDRDLLEVGAELGYLSAAQIEDIVKRLADLRRGGITITAGQALLDRKFLTPAQLHILTTEAAQRQAGNTSDSSARAATPGAKSASTRSSR